MFALNVTDWASQCLIKILYLGNKDGIIKWLTCLSIPARVRTCPVKDLSSTMHCSLGLFLRIKGSHMVYIVVCSIVTVCVGSFHFTGSRDVANVPSLSLPEINREASSLNPPQQTNNTHALNYQSPETKLV